MTAVHIPMMVVHIPMMIVHIPMMMVTVHIPTLHNFQLVPLFLQTRCHFVSCESVQITSAGHIIIIIIIIIIVIIIIIIIILGIFFMHGIYTYIPGTNHVPRKHCVATILM
jgi:hypothetical protein